MIQAVDYLQREREQSISIISKTESIPAAELGKTLDGLHILDLPEYIKILKLNKSSALYSSFLFTTEFLIKRGQITGRIKFEEFVEPAFINNIGEQK